MPQDRDGELQALLVKLREALSTLDRLELHQAAAHLSMSIHIAERHLPETHGSQEPDS